MASKAPGLAKGRVNANSRAYRARKKGKPAHAVNPSLGIFLPGRATVALQFKLVSAELPDDDTTVLLLMLNGEPELAYHAEGAWWGAGRELYMIEDVPLAWAYVPSELPAEVLAHLAVRPVPKPLTAKPVALKQRAGGGQ